MSLIAGLFSVVLAVLGMLVAAAPAQAAASCKGTSCTGKDPQAQGCTTGARTVRHFATPSLYIELRYSPKCRALWARWGVQSTGMTQSDYIFIRRYNSAGKITKQYRTTTGIMPGDQGWTKMIGRPKSAAQFRACNFIAQQCTSPWPQRPRAAAATSTPAVASAPAGATVAADAAAVGGPHCVWRVYTHGAPVYARNGHGQWYVLKRKGKGVQVKGPANESPDWVHVYLGQGGEGLMWRWDLRLKSGQCR